ncbi:MAG: hypothetical protein J5I50_12415 [Chitinophagaceae bacterium]|nr:hypothetical protein [Chitinophagaceae bacterium]
MDLSNGLLLHYSFSGNVVNTAGNGLQGTVNGDLQFTADRFGNPNSIAYFNGTNANIVIHYNGLLSTPASVCAIPLRQKKFRNRLLSGKQDIYLVRSDDE